MMTFLKDNKMTSGIAGLSFILVYASSFNSAYGYFIDEFYYISCAARPAFGYVDHPPLAPFILTVFSFLFGTSIYAIRLLPALALAVSVFMTGRLAARLGGDSKAQALAALAVACSPVAVTFAGFYSMNVFEPLIAILMIIESIKMIQDNKPQKWLTIGLLTGIGIMNKHTYAIAALMLFVSLLLSGHWRLFRSRYFVYGMLFSFLIILPNILWQYFNHFPSLEFYRNITVSKNIYTPPIAFLLQQLLFMSPLTAPLWIAGIIFLLTRQDEKIFRFISIFFLFVFLFMMLSGTSRPDRLLFAYPAVFAGGAVFFERFLNKFRFKALHGILPSLMLAGLAISIPICLPYFSYQQTADYTKAIGLNTELERGKKPPLPQILADRIGWEEKADLLFSLYNSLPAEEKQRTIIATDNYGKAGALELFGRQYGIAEVFCGHNSFYLWGRGHLHGSTVLMLDDIGSADDYTHAFDSVEVSKKEFTHPFVSAHENHLVVFTCRNPKLSLDTLFKRGRFYY